VADALAFLYEEHEGILDLCNQLTGGAGEPGGTPRERWGTAQRLVIAGSKHEVIEEQFLWPLVRQRVKGGQFLSDAGIEQEAGAKNLLHELNHMQADNSHFMTMVHQVASHLRDHVTYEQNQIFPKLQMLLTAQELAELGDQLVLAKKAAPTRPHPHASPDPRFLKTMGPLVAAMDRALDAVTGRGRGA
jgi:hypothetical protein